MPEGDPRPENVKKRLRLRPKELGMGGTLLGIAVAVVIFIGIVIWYSTFPSGVFSPNAISDYEATHLLIERFEQKYPQLAGNSEAYFAEAEMAYKAQNYMNAEELLEKAIAANPNNYLAFELLSELVLSHSEAFRITKEEAHAVKKALEACKLTQSCQQY